MAGAPELDGTLLAVLANRFEAIVREMTNTLFRTGRSAVLNMARDFSCSIVSADDQLLAAAEGLQVHVLGAGLQTASMRELHPDLARGDAFLHNDPYLGNTHTADFTLLVPVFHAGEHVFTACAKAHQADCGNAAPSTYMPYAADLYEEGGLNFPCVQIQRDYRDIDDIVRMCRRRIRVADMWYGDYLAMVGAGRIGERRIGETIERYGAATIKAFVERWLDYSEQRAQAALRELPTCELRGSSPHDPMPGHPDGIPVQVGLSIDGEEGRVVVDLTDNVDCLDNGLNLSRCSAMAGSVIGIFNCLDPDLPHNAGSFRRIEVRIRQGSAIGGLEFPHSASVATTNLSNRLINSVQAAVAAVGDGHGLAEGAGAMGVGYSVFSGNDRRNGSPYVNQMVIGNNGGPASATADGWVTYAMPDCAKTVYIDSVEVLEQRYPLRIRSLRLLPDSGGAGRHRGGPAGEMVYGPVADPLQAFYFADFAHNPPQGVRGGAPGGAARAAKIEADGSAVPRPAIGDVELVPGEWVLGVESGGGGYGDPLERDPELVLDDLLEGWISAAAARDVYGVEWVGTVEDDSLEVVGEATKTRRERLREGLEKK
ncbi:MAG: hydantoinase B/oxoprolinase family protein [Actinobacteria bacterium]|nr:hydantoinase B/oxoprolinase family protein [Actinomycetota bacterium]